MRRVKKAGVLPDSLIKEMLGCGDISFTAPYSSDFSPSMLSLLVVDGFPAGKDEVLIEKGEKREFGLNVGIGSLHSNIHLFGDGKTTPARIGLYVDVIDSQGAVLPCQPSAKYPGHISPHPGSGNLMARLTADDFPVLMKRGKPVANLRAFNGDPAEALLDPRLLGNVLYVDGKPVPPDELETENGWLKMHLNLNEAIQNGWSGYVSNENVRKAIVYDKTANFPKDFFGGIPTCACYKVKSGTLVLLYTFETLDLTGKGKYNKQPATGFMRRRVDESASIINGATMLDSEPPRRLATEIRSKVDDMRLYDRQPICNVALYSYCEMPQMEKKHTSGNRHQLGKLFRTNGY